MTTPANGDGTLAGTRWTLTALNGREPLEGTGITLSFRDGGVRGDAGCNSYSANDARTEDGAFRIGPVATTRIACKGPVGEQESAYLKALQTPGTYRLSGDRLEVRNASGETILVFQKRPN